MDFLNRPLTEGEIAFCIIGFGVFFIQAVFGALYEIFGPKKIRTPRLYWHPETRTWHTDGSQEMVNLAMQCAKPGDSITFAKGSHTWGSVPPPQA